jgi:hypothetical protein
MDRATLKQKLLEAKAYLALLNEHIDRQRDLVERLRKRRLDTREARKYLRALEKQRVESIAELRRLTTLALRSEPPSADEKGKL